MSRIISDPSVAGFLREVYSVFKKHDMALICVLGDGLAVVDLDEDSLKELREVVNYRGKSIGDEIEQGFTDLVQR